MIAYFKVIQNNRNESESLDEKTGNIEAKRTRALIAKAVSSPEGQPNPWNGTPNGALHIGGIDDKHFATVKTGDTLRIEITRP